MTQVAFGLDRNGHPAGHLHLVAEPGMSACGREVAEPIPHLDDEAGQRLALTMVTCPQCKIVRQAGVLPPGVYVGHVDDVWLTPWVDDGIHIALDSTTWRSMPVEQVPTHGLWATQKGIFKKYLRQYEKNPTDPAPRAADGDNEGDLPWVVIYQGKTWVLDGHHRFSIAAAAGLSHISAHVMRPGTAHEAASSRAGIEVEQVEKQFRSTGWKGVVSTNGTTLAYRGFGSWGEARRAVRDRSWSSAGMFTVAGEGETQMALSLRDVLAGSGLHRLRGTGFLGAIEADIGGLPFRTHMTIEANPDGRALLKPDLGLGIGIDGGIPLDRIRRVFRIENEKVVAVWNLAEFEVVLRGLEDNPDWPGPELHNDRTTQRFWACYNVPGAKYKVHRLDDTQSKTSCGKSPGGFQSKMRIPYRAIMDNTVTTDMLPLKEEFLPKPKKKLPPCEKCFPDTQRPWVEPRRAPEPYGGRARPSYSWAAKTAADYWGGHRPIEDAPPLHDLTDMFGEDIYTHPEWYVGDTASSWARTDAALIRRVRGKPTEQVIVYRAMPTGTAPTLNPGDWVATSESYARQHAMQSNDPSDDWPVYAATVQVQHVRNGGSDIHEWGYWGPPVPLHLKKQAAMQTTADADTSGVMIALVPPEATSKTLMDATDASEPLDQQHLTLLYLGSQEDAGGQWGRERLYRACYDFAIHSGYRGLSGKPNGWGAFFNPEDDGGGVLIALWDIPGIAEFRTHLQDALKRHGVPLRQDNHGFTPHQTMTYQDKPFRELPEPPEVDEVHFTDIVIAWGDEPWQRVALP